MRTLRIPQMARATSRTFRNVQLNLETLESREMPSSTVLDALTNSASYTSDRILVRWLNDSPVESPYAQDSHLLGGGTYSVDLKSGVSVSDALAWYKAQSGVDFAQSDALIHISQTANDTYASQQWALSAIGASTAWNYTTGNRQIVVAVVDTGVDYNHADLSANIWKNTNEIAGNGRDDDGNGYVDDYYGFNFTNSTSNPMDDNGHGTHVAGIIGAVGNNSTGIAGVNWNVQIMSLKFMDSSGTGYTSNAVSAIYYAVNNGARVINNSWGGGGYDQALATAIQYARNRGVIVVNAAGNSSANIDASPSYPASIKYDNVLTVAATDQNNNLASFSNYGVSTVDIAAPGVSIISTYTSNRYAYMSGTSMAAPYVAGAAALIWSENPTWTYSQVINDLLSTTTASASLNGRVAHGVLNIGKAAQGVQPQPGAPAPSLPAPTVTANPASQSIAAGGAASFTASATNAASVRWQASADGGTTWNDLSDGGNYSGAASNTLTVSGALTSMNGFKFRAVFSNGSGLTATSTSAQLTVTSNSTYNAYVNAYNGYIYAYYAYATGGGQYAYTAYVNAYYAYYFAYYAHYYTSIGKSGTAAVCSYYSQYYANQAAYYSYVCYVTTGNVYAYYAYHYTSYASSYSYNAVRGY
jgi:subtilisin family serine protease